MAISRPDKANQFRTTAQSQPGSRTGIAAESDRAIDAAQSIAIPETRITVRRASESDIASIQYIARRTWADTYRDVIPPDAQDKILSIAYSDLSLAVSIGRGQAFLVAQEGDTVSGYVDVDFDGSRFNLHRLYILPTSQRSGLGRTLLSEAVRALAPSFVAPNERWTGVREAPGDSNPGTRPDSIGAAEPIALPFPASIPPGAYNLVATVERDNPKGRAFYAKMGFVEGKEENVTIGGIALPLVRISAGVVVLAPT